MTRLRIISHLLIMHDLSYDRIVATIDLALFLLFLFLFGRAPLKFLL
jgi:hypothetical protein